MKQRIQLEYQVTIMVDVDDKRPRHLTEFRNPTVYAMQFVDVSPCIHGSHDVDFVDGRIVKAIEVVDTDVRCTAAFIN